MSKFRSIRKRAILFSGAAIIALAGSLANTSNDQATKTSIGSGATINVGVLGLYTNHNADIDSLSDAFTIAVRPHVRPVKKTFVQRRTKMPSPSV